MITLIEILNEDFEEISEYDLENRYCEFLDEVYGPVNIAGLTYDTSSVLKEVDPTAFRCGLNDWSDEEYTEVNGTTYLKSDVREAEEILENEEAEENEENEEE
jgi:hypothetical protein